MWFLHTRGCFNKKTASFFGKKCPLNPTLLFTEIDNIISFLTILGEHTGKIRG